MRQAMPLAALLFTALALWAAGCRPETAATPPPPQPVTLPSFPGAKTSEGLEVSAALDDGSMCPRVGAPLRARVRFRNVSDHPISFGHEPGEGPVRIKLRYAEPFGDRRPPDCSWGCGGGGFSSVDGRKVVRLAPGQTWEEEVAVVPKLPGAAGVCLKLVNTYESSWGLVTGKPRPDGSVPVSGGLAPMENPWKGKADFDFLLKVESCSDCRVTPSWGDRRRVLERKAAPLSEKIRALEFSGDERTATAVAFLVEQVKLLPADSPLRPFAVRQLADMASADYGFEAIDLLLEIAGNAAEPANVRALIAELVDLLRGQRSIRFVVDGNEGEYLVSGELRKRAQDIWETARKP